MKLIAGVDEAGRGALAGPVVAAAVILPDEYDLVGLNDSKKVSPLKREKLFAKITNQAISIGVGIVSHYEIDKINILESTFKAMKMALGKLKPFPDEALIDGFPLKICQIGLSNFSLSDCLSNLFNRDMNSSVDFGMTSKNNFLARLGF